MAMAMAVKHITILAGERACINCKQYRRGFVEEDIPGEVYKRMTPISTGYCLKRECQRGALRQPCEDYETTENPRP